MPAKKATKKAAKKTAAKRSMSASHKQALATGREQGRIVRAYLGALQASGKPGARVSRDQLQKRLADVNEQIDAEPDPAKRLDLIQKRIDLEGRLSGHDTEADTEQLEQDFIAVAKRYSERKGISYTAWREVGVPAAILKAAGVPRTRRTSARS
jgi:hypothetical protein